MKLRLYLMVIPAGTSGVIGASGELWYREIETGALPTVDDHVILWAGENGDPGDGPPWSICRRWLGANGSWVVELVRMVVDPDEGALSTIRSLLAQGDSEYWPWHTDVNGDPTPKLAAGGWQRYA